MSGSERHGRDDGRPVHHAREALSAVGDASAQFLATLFADGYHEPWEDAVRRYDEAHPSRS